MNKNNFYSFILTLVFILLLIPHAPCLAGAFASENRIASVSHIEKSPYHNYFYRDRQDEVTADGFSGGDIDDAKTAGGDLKAALQSAEPSSCIKFDDVKGSGKYPYNFRVIDNKLFAGGNLFNPVTLSNSAERVKKYLMLLKVIGAKNIIALNVPATQNRELKMVKQLCAELGLNFYACRMNSETVPDDKQTVTLMRLIDEGAYVHCNWGCDRTGAVIAKYLVLKKGYSGEEAFKAVISKGSHSGSLGGLKQTPTYKKLVLYFWPEIAEQNPNAADKYRIGYAADEAPASVR
jgi:protein-tyrosine phosphatase